MLDAIDIVLIHQLLGRYGHLIDRGDWDRFNELFTPDATIDYKGGRGRTQREGRDAVVHWFRSVEDSNPPAHHVSNIWVDEQGDPNGSVDVWSKFFAPFSRDHHEPKRLYGGDYHDIVVKTVDGWRFQHKSCQPTWQLTVTVDDSGPDIRHTY